MWTLERRDANAVGDGAAVTVAYLDQLGRERRKRTLESAVSSDTSAAAESGGIFVDTAYEVNATRNAVKVSNPYRS